MKIVVTGGYGLVGKSLQKIITQLNKNANDNFIFLSRQDCDLRDVSSVYHLFETINPDVVIHLASCVGGVYENMSNNYNYLIDNARLNINIVDACHKFKVKRLINILSTCIFPDNEITYPLTSDQLHNGLPHHSNIGYAYSKRILHLASHLLVDKTNKSGDFKVINLTPTNLYGQNDNFNLQSSHVIPGLIHKTYLSKINNTPLKINGSGNARRQFLYVDDLARVIYNFIYLEIQDSEISIIVSPPETDEISISDLVMKICKYSNFTGNVDYDDSFSDGQIKKTATDKELMKYLDNFTFTTLDIGLQETIQSFVKNFNIIRK